MRHFQQLNRFRLGTSYTSQAFASLDACTEVYLNAFLPKSCALGLGCTLLAATSVASPPSPSSKRLLVESIDQSSATVKQVLGSAGTVTAVDPPSGLFVVQLKSSANYRPVKAKLRQSRKLRLVLNGDQKHIAMSNDESVTDHLRYLQAIERHNTSTQPDKGEKERGHESETLSHWGAYQHWLHDHVGRDGNFDATPYVRAAKARDALTLIPFAAGPAAITAKWSYVGPHNQQPVIGRQFDGLPPLAGRVNAVAVDPKNNNNVFLCTAGGGAWKSTNKGGTWTPLSDSWQSMQTSSVAIDPNTPSTIFIGTGDFPSARSIAFGVMKSTNSGSTWTNVGASVFNGVAISRIMVDPGNSKIIIATGGRGSGSGGGIYRSTDGGTTWTKAAAPTVNWDGLSVSLPNNSGVRTFFAAGEGSSGANQYKSTDDGSTWSKVSVPFPNRAHNSVDVACSKVSPGTLFVLDPNNPDSSSTQNSGNHIWKSTNGGTSWTDVIKGFPNGDSADGPNYTWDQDDYNLYIGTSKITNGTATTDGVYVGLITIAMSDDGGSSWIDLSKAYQTNDVALSHTDNHAFFADPTTANTVYFGNDGGVNRMTYNPAKKAGTFSPLNLTLYNTQWYFVATHPTDITRLMGGLQDNANPASVGDLSKWINPGAGDGSAVCYDPFNPSIAYNSTQKLSVFRTTDGWATTSDISDSGNPAYNGESTNFLPPIVTSIKGNKAGVLYAGTDHLWQWDSTNNWTADITGTALAGQGNNLRTIATCPSDATRVYTGSDDGQVWAVTGLNNLNNAVATQVDNGFSGGLPVVSIAVSPTNPKDVLAALAGVGDANLYRCSNTAAVSPVWTAVNGSGKTAIPTGNVNSVVRDPGNPASVWYVGTDLGVFMTTNSGSTWSNLTNPFGLPNVTVNHLVANAATGFLYAGTYGRGLWNIALPSPSLVSVGLKPIIVTGGASNSTGTVFLTGVFATPITVKLSSSDAATASVPATVTVPAGRTSVSFTVTTKAPTTSGEKVTISATYGVTKSATLTVY